MAVQINIRQLRQLLSTQSLALLKKENNTLLLQLSIIVLVLIASYACVATSYAAELLRVPIKTPYTLQATPITRPIRIPILLYHYIEHVKDTHDTIRMSMNVMPEVFETQIKTLTGAGYTLITASELSDILDGVRLLPKNPILITIDDGHWDLYTDIVPILKKYNAKATAYIIDGAIGGKDFLSEEQLHSISLYPNLEIGAHTVHHVPLANLPYDTTWLEIVHSKMNLEKKLNRRVTSFAYPSGSFDNQAVEIVRAAHYTTAMSTITGDMQSTENRYTLSRLRPGNRIGADLLFYIEKTTFQDTPY